MLVHFSRRLAVVMAVLVLATAAAAGEILSTMRNVSSVAEAHGFRLNIVHDAQIPPLPSDLSPAQAFEVLRPPGKSVTIGRLFTSCSCIQLESPKRTYGPDERVVLTLRNIKPTPPAGQVYAVFVQITNPVRTTLRFDTYVQSGMAGGMPFESAAIPPSSGSTAAGAGSTSSSGLASTSTAPGYQGSPHADAVAALTRQIDQGMAAAVKQPGTTLISLPAPMAPPAQPGKLGAPAVTEAVVEVESQEDLPPAAAKATKVEEEDLEARGTPSPLPPPAELTRETIAAPAGRIGVEVTAAPMVDDQTAVTAIRQTLRSGEFDDDDEEYGYDADDDAVSPLLPAPTISPLQDAPRGITPQSIAAVVDQFANDPDDQPVAGKGIDLAAPDDEDMGTANLVEGYRNLDDFYAQSAKAADELASKITTGATTAAVQDEAPRYALPAQVEEEDDPAYWSENRPEAEYRAEETNGGALPPPTISSPASDFGAAYIPEQQQPIRATLEPVLTTQVVQSPAQVQVQIQPQVQPQVQVQPQIPVQPQIQPQVQTMPVHVPAGVYESGTPEPRPEVLSSESRKPVQAVSLITIGARDMAKSIHFYETIGWRRAARGKYDQTAFFQLQGQILALYPMNDLLREQNMPEASPAPGGMTLALHVQDRSDVWSVYQRFVDAGGTSLRAPAEMASGAVTSYVADPDGNAWEISWVPQFRIDEEGGLWLP